MYKNKLKETFFHINEVTRWGWLEWGDHSESHSTELAVIRREQGEY